ncbi:MAG TPA: GGDEF domain-containing protein [Candidatus Paceibacterota bacterium]
MNPSELDGKVNELLLGLPQELSARVREKVSFYKTKSPVFSTEEVYREAMYLVRLEMLAYLDRRAYLGMYNRRWAEHKIGEYVRRLVDHPKHESKDIYSLARVNLDLNGLKALNDLAGHEAGNKGLKLFANILNFGATTIWLRDELHLEVTTSAEGGDEFGIVIAGLPDGAKKGVDLREYSEEIVHRYFEEVYSADVSHFIDFTKPEVRGKLVGLGISDEVPKDFIFRMSTSVGLCTFGEALDLIDVSRADVKFSEVVADITNAMFATADKRSMINKSEFKRKLGESNPILSGLYARMSREVIHLERELKAKNEKIRELEVKLKEK